MPLLLSLDPPSFTHPVSQPCTAKQMREPAFRARCRSLGNLPADRTESWQVAYVIQALERYGMLQAGARGLALGDNQPAVTQALIAGGATHLHMALSESDSGEGTPFIDPADLPGDLFAFDFLLSIRGTDRLGSDQSAAFFIEKGMECLRPGGLAVHVIGHHPAPTTLPNVAFDRNGLERIALSLISRGHQVARMKPALPQHASKVGEDGVVPFGLIAQRAALIR